MQKRAFKELQASRGRAGEPLRRARVRMDEADKRSRETLLVYTRALRELGVGRGSQEGCRRALHAYTDAWQEFVDAEANLQKTRQEYFWDVIGQQRQPAESSEFDKGTLIASRAGDK